jgi:hypothetical protein
VDLRKEKYEEERKGSPSGDRSKRESVVEISEELVAGV